MWVFVSTESVQRPLVIPCGRNHGCGSCGGATQNSTAQHVNKHYPDMLRYSGYARRDEVIISPAGRNFWGQKISFFCALGRLQFTFPLLHPRTKLRAGGCVCAVFPSSLASPRHGAFVRGGRRRAPRDGSSFDSIRHAEQDSSNRIGGRCLEPHRIR